MMIDCSTCRKLLWEHARLFAIFDYDLELKSVDHIENDHNDGHTMKNAQGHTCDECKEVNENYKYTEIRLLELLNFRINRHKHGIRRENHLDATSTDFVKALNVYVSLEVDKLRSGMSEW